MKSEYEGGDATTVRMTTWKPRKRNWRGDRVEDMRREHDEGVEREWGEILDRTKKMLVVQVLSRKVSKKILMRAVANDYL